MKRQLTRLADSVESPDNNNLSRRGQERLARRTNRYEDAREHLDRHITRHNLNIDNFQREIDRYNQDVNTHIAAHQPAADRISEFESYDVPEQLHDGYRASTLNVELARRGQARDQAGSTSYESGGPSDQSGSGGTTMYPYPFGNGF